MKDNLKPCPFCGTQPIGGCMMCNCIDEDGHVDPEVWNNRPIEDALRAEIEQLKKAIRRVKDDLDYVVAKHAYTIGDAYQLSDGLHKANTEIARLRDMLNASQVEHVEALSEIEQRDVEIARLREK